MLGAELLCWGLSFCATVPELQPHPLPTPHPHPPPTPAPAAEVPAAHWRRVLQLLGLTPAQKRDILAARSRLLGQMRDVLAERLVLGQRLLAAQPPALEYLHITRVGLEVGGWRGWGSWRLLALLALLGLGRLHTMHLGLVVGAGAGALGQRGGTPDAQRHAAAAAPLTQQLPTSLTTTPHPAGHGRAGGRGCPRPQGAQRQHGVCGLLLQERYRCAAHGVVT